MMGARAITMQWLWGLVLLLALAGTRGAPAQSRFDWTEGFGLPGTNGVVDATAVYDDGSGPALYAGGGFTTAGGVAANHIARWNGTSWSALGSGMNSIVYALTEYDDGSGPALYAGGDFTTAGGRASARIGKWAAVGEPLAPRPEAR